MAPWRTGIICSLATFACITEAHQQRLKGSRRAQVAVEAPPEVDKVARVQAPHTNLTFSRVALGGLHFADFKDNVTGLVDLLQTAAKMGITTLDLADVYGWYKDGYGVSNDLVSQAFQRKPGLRESFQIVCKFGIRLSGGYRVDTSPDWIRASVQRYLRLLNTTYLDVLMIHNPDPAMNPDAVAAVFRELKDKDTVTAFGISNFRPWEYRALRDAMAKQGLKLSVHEMEASVLHPDKISDGTVESYSQGPDQLLVLAWGPLGGDPNGGTNLLFNAKGAREHRIMQSLTAKGVALGAGADQVAVAWLLHASDNIVPILGTTKKDRLMRQGLQTRRVPFSNDDFEEVGEQLFYDKKS